MAADFEASRKKEDTKSAKTSTGRTASEIEIFYKEKLDKERLVFFLR